GSKSILMRMPATGNEVPNAYVKDLSVKQDRLFLRVLAQYLPDYSHDISALNGLRFSDNYNMTGPRPNGIFFFLIKLENVILRSEAQPGYTHAYVYHPEQDDVYGEHWYSDGVTSNGAQSFGQYFVARPNVVPTRGKWICFEVMVQMNTPGSRDGRVAVWQDGVLIADWQNVRVRDVETG